jgi:protein ImuB
MSPPMELYACLYAREFPAQALLRLRPELRAIAFAVLEGEPPLQSVCSLNSKARSLGVVRGMTKVEMDTFPSVETLARCPAEEAAAKDAMLECAGTFSPRIEERCFNNDLACVIDVAGTEKLFGPPRTLAQTLMQRVRSLGITASVTVSRNFHAAICLARGTPRADVVIVAPGGERAAMAPLPLSVLDISQEHAETFALWGIQTLGTLAELPEKELIARMGQEGKRLRRLAHGELPQLFVPIEPEVRLEERMELDTPIELLDSLLFVVGVMLEQLILRATTRVLALASLTITLSLEGGASHSRTVRPALASNDRQLWIKLLHLDLEAHPPLAAILALTLTAESGSTSKVQLGLFSPQLPEPMRFDITLARIRAIVGEDCVGSPVLKDTHRHDAFGMEPFTVSLQTASTTGPTRSIAAMRQLRPTESATVTLRDQRPATFFFRDKRYTVEQAYGPWLAGGEWWNPTLWSVEQWDTVARSQDGLLLCCCLVRDLTQSCWQMVALYD